MDAILASRRSAGEPKKASEGSGRLNMAAVSKIIATSSGRITVGDTTYQTDVYILPSGEVRRRRLDQEGYGASHKIGPAELERICRGNPKKVFVGTGQSGAAELTPEGREYLRAHGIAFYALPTPEVIGVYNRCNEAKAALLHITS